MNATVQSMQVYHRTGNQAQQMQIDPLPQVDLEGAIIWGDQTHYSDDKEFATQIDYCNPEDWGRVYLDDKPGADFYKNPGNDEMFFPLYSTSNGSPATATLFYLVSTLNYWNLNPQNSGMITGLTAPSTDYSY